MSELKDYLIFRDFIFPVILIGGFFIIYCIYWLVDIVREGYKKQKNEKKRNL